MIVVTIGKFIDETLRYADMASQGEKIEIVLKNGEVLQFSKKDNEK